MRAAALVLMSVLGGCVTVARLPRAQLEHPGGLLFNGYVRPEVTCWRCHNGNGRGARGPSLVVRAPALSNSRMRKVINDGFGFMPGFKKHLSAEEVEQIIAWQHARFPQVNHLVSPGAVAEPPEYAAPP